MIVKDLQKITTYIKNGQRLLSIDVSKKHLGLGISDGLLKIAFPYKTIIRNQLKIDLHTIKEIINKEEVYAIVVGYPLNLDGKKNSRTQSIDSFIAELKKVIPIDIYTQDERFSTKFVVHSHLHNKTDTQVDEQAAAWFLQIFLDKLS